MPLLNLEKENISQKFYHELNHLIIRLAQKIEKEEKIPEEFLEREIEKIKNNFPKNTFLIQKEKILEKALEQVKERLGWLPTEKLSKKYEDLIKKRIIQEIIERIESGENKYSLLKEYGKKLKKERIDYLIGEIEKEVNNKLKFKNGAVAKW